eukprot:scaffold64962_cov63-Phaeocystis_antarctica.AAC.1
MPALHLLLAQTQLGVQRRRHRRARPLPRRASLRRLLAQGIVHAPRTRHRPPHEQRMLEQRLDAATHRARPVPAAQRRLRP